MVVIRYNLLIKKEEKVMTKNKVWLKSKKLLDFHEQAQKGRDTFHLCNERTSEHP